MPGLLSQLSHRKFFLLDAFGALLSALLLGGLLASFPTTFGMPPKTLYLLAGIACLFSIYSLLNYFSRREGWQPFLRAIAIANLLYCALTLSLVIYFYPQLTVWGIAYFVGEMILVIFLAIQEWKKANS